MKKLMSLFIVLSLVAVSVFADEAADVINGMEEEERFEAQKTATMLITPKEENFHLDSTFKNQHPKVTLEFNPLYDELRIHYVVNYTTFERGEAMNVVLAVIQDFMQGKIEYDGYENYRYRSYRYLQNPKETSRIEKNGNRKSKVTEYFCYIQLRDRSPFSKGSKAAAEE